MTQITRFYELAPGSQEAFLFLPRTTDIRALIKDVGVRPIAKTLDGNKHWQVWPQPFPLVLDVTVMPIDATIVRRSENHDPIHSNIR